MEHMLGMAEVLTLQDIQGLGGTKVREAGCVAYSNDDCRLYSTLQSSNMVRVNWSWLPACV